MDFITQRLKLKDINPQQAKDLAQEHNLKEEELLFIRKGFIVEKSEVDEKERSIVSYISTDVKDRDGDILEPKGAKLNYYKQNPVVLWAHQYGLPPIGKNLWIKKDDNGIKAKTQFAPTKLAEEIYGLYKGEYLKAWSVGFIPLEWEILESNKKDDSSLKPEGKRYTKWELLEYSAVPVPSNPEALCLAIKSGEIKIEDKQLMEDLDIEIIDESKEVKRVIPYKETPKAPEDTPWQAGREVREAEISDLKIMCTWYDTENPDVKSSYKLPHHKASGAHPVVWRGVAAAMGALLGARGGVNIPDGDRKGVYNHLKKHYGQFDKEPPEFREYSEEELKELFEEDILGIEIAYLKSKIKDLTDIIIGLQAEFAHIKSLTTDDSEKYLQSSFDGLPNINTVIAEKKDEEVIEIIESEKDNEFDIDPEEIKKIVKESIKELDLNKIVGEKIDIAKGKIIEE